MGDMKRLKRDPPEFIEAVPAEDNMLVWYFLIQGPQNSDYEGGYYLGKIKHHPNYPFNPPDFEMLTPSGRFELGGNICTTNTGYHSGEWSPMWTINALLIGFLSIMLDEDMKNGRKANSIRHLHSSKSERQRLAKLSVQYNKQHHSNILPLFTRFLDEKGDPRDTTQPERINKSVKSKSEKVSHLMIDKWDNNMYIRSPTITKTDERYARLLERVNKDQPSNG